MNDAIVKGLKAMGKLKGKEYTFTIMEAKNLNPEKKHFAENYKNGDIVYTLDDRTFYKVSGVDENNNTITIKKGKEKFTINLIQDSNKISVYREREVKLQE